MIDWLIVFDYCLIDWLIDCSFVRLQVIYGDTDSVMIRFFTDNIAEAMRLGEEAAKKVRVGACGVLVGACGVQIGVWHMLAVVSSGLKWFKVVVFALKKRWKTIGKNALKMHVFCVGFGRVYSTDQAGVWKVLLSVFADQQKAIRWSAVDQCGKVRNGNAENVILMRKSANWMRKSVFLMWKMYFFMWLFFHWFLLHFSLIFYVFFRHDKMDAKGIETVRRDNWYPFSYPP